MINGVELIAEVKTKSPFGFESGETWESLFEVANQFGDIISIHTDSRWGGSFEDVLKAKGLTNKPILAKGIHLKDSDVSKAVELGADFVLVVGRIPQVHLDKCLIEPLNLEELRKIPLDFKVVWNSRDLETGDLKKETFEEALNIWDGWICQASNLSNLEDIKEGADAVIVGSNLKRFVQSLDNI